MNKNHHLVMTGLEDFWDKDSNLMYFPWSALGKSQKGLDDSNVLTLWKPRKSVVDALEYCYQIYNKLLPQCARELNKLHQVSLDEQYWRVLVGPWLIYFIEMFYDRYNRIYNAFLNYPDMETYILLKKDVVDLDSYDFNDFMSNHVFDDYYNLKIFSFIIHNLYSENGVEKTPRLNHQESKKAFTLRELKKEVTKRLQQKKLSSIVFCDMYHLKWYDKLKLRKSFRNQEISFLECNTLEDYDQGCSTLSRQSIHFDLESDNPFDKILCKILPFAMPRIAVENYKFFRSKIQEYPGIKSVKAICSTTGWYYNENFKFLAAEVSQQGALLLDFQHGGGYGHSLGHPYLKLSLEKDMFYTWGWKASEADNTKALPSPHISKIVHTHNKKIDKFMFIGVMWPKYLYHFQTQNLPDDMSVFFDRKKQFFDGLSSPLRKKFLYRPYGHEFGWNETRFLEKNVSDIGYAPKGKLTKWMQKISLVVMDQPGTSMLETLAMNVPTILYWDHDVFLMRTDSEKYFDILRDAGILFKDPLQAAKKVEEISQDPQKWWNQSLVQKARSQFAQRYALSDKNWAQIWAKEIEFQVDNINKEKTPILSVGVSA